MLPLQRYRIGVRRIKLPNCIKLSMTFESSNNSYAKNTQHAFAFKFIATTAFIDPKHNKTLYIMDCRVNPKSLFCSRCHAEMDAVR